MRTLTLCYLHCEKSDMFLALNVWTWSYLNRRGNTIFEINCCIIFMATSAVVFVTTFALQNFDHLFIATKIHREEALQSLNKLYLLIRFYPKFYLEQVFLSFIGLRFLPYSEHWLQLWVIWTFDQCLCGNHMSWYSSSMSRYVLVRCRLSRIVWRSCVGTTIRSSINRQSSRTRSRFLIFYQYWPYDDLIDSQSRSWRNLWMVWVSCLFLWRRQKIELRAHSGVSGETVVCPPPIQSLSIVLAWGIAKATGFSDM